MPCRRSLNKVCSCFAVWVTRHCNISLCWTMRNIPTLWFCLFIEAPKSPKQGRNFDLRYAADCYKRNRQKGGSPSVWNHREELSVVGPKVVEKFAPALRYVQTGCESHRVTPQPICTGCLTLFEVEYHQILTKIVLVSEFKFPNERRFATVSEWISDDPKRCLVQVLWLTTSLI